MSEQFWPDDLPKPGSPEARDVGCKCPVIDNCRGAGAYIDPETGRAVYWVNEECALHGDGG